MKMQRRSFVTGLMGGLFAPVIARAANIPTSNFNNGTNASSSTFLRGDGTWSIPPGVISFDSLGAVGDGVTDDTAAFAAIAGALPKGGTCFLTAGKNYRTSSSWTLSSGVTLKGPYGHFGFQANAGFQSAFGNILLGSGATINMQATSCIDGCCIIPFGMTFPQSTSSWSGTAITISGGSDQTIKDSMIAGFNQGILATGGQRFNFVHLQMDNVNGISVSNSFDICRYESVHCWPFLSVNLNTNLTRSGTAFSINNSDDWSMFRSCFAFGYNIGFINNASAAVTFDGCGTDTCAAAGFLIENGSVDSILDACQAGGCGNGILIQVTGGLGGVQCNGCMLWANTASGIAAGATNTAAIGITGGTFRGNAVWGVNIASATKAVINGATFLQNGSAGAAGTAGTGQIVGCNLNGGTVSGFTQTACF